MFKLYGRQTSGNCYKPRLLLALLGQPFQHIETAAGELGTRSAAFQAKNPAGRVPLLELEDGRVLAESNAILCYLDAGSAFTPQDAFSRARMLQWMFFEQNSHEPAVAARRALLRNPRRMAEATPEKLEALRSAGLAALAVMEDQLSRTAFLAAATPTLADISLFAYTHVADEGEFDLGPFPCIRSWLSSIEALPGFQPMTWRPS
ncbi:glutathione S-transferase family protein [Consotaella aegiceratis]|uniref:glutathione S-transferase family protein n=1 Tax=Consotaella aegiceratis TaxID=3097961 RepID=UPI002F4001EE